MRSVPGQRDIPYLKWILGVTIVGFIIQNVVRVAFNFPPGFMGAWFGLGVEQMMHARVWTILTYSLLHGGIFHILVNCLVIFFTWRALEPLMSQKRLLQVYLGAVVLGGLVYLGVHYRGGTVEGASAGALGLLMLYCLLQPDRPMTLLLFFVIPVTLRPRWIVWILVGFDAFGFFFTELPGILGQQAMIGSSVAYSAHLGGMLAGYLFFKFASSPGYSSSSNRKVKIEPPSWLQRKPRATKTSRGFTLNMSSRSDLKKEVDRILDKINSQGFGSLSEEEKETLDKAKDILKN